MCLPTMGTWLLLKIKVNYNHKIQTMLLNTRLFTPQSGEIQIFSQDKTQETSGYLHKPLCEG